MGREAGSGLGSGQLAKAVPGNDGRSVGRGLVAGEQHAPLRNLTADSVMSIDGLDMSRPATSMPCRRSPRARQARPAVRSAKSRR